MIHDKMKLLVSGNIEPNVRIPQSLQMHGRQRQNLTPLLILQLGTHNSVQSRTNRVSSLSYKHTSIIIEPHHRPILPLHLLCCPDYDRVSDVATTDFVRSTDGDGAARTGFWTKISLFLDYYYYSVAFGRLVHGDGS